MTGVYLSYLPRGFIRSIAGFPQEGKSYFLPRAQETPEEALYTQIWPETDVWLQRMEAYHPDRTDNEVVRLDLAGSGFLRLLRALRLCIFEVLTLCRLAQVELEETTLPIARSADHESKETVSVLVYHIPAGTRS